MTSIRNSVWLPILITGLALVATAATALWAADAHQSVQANHGSATSPVLAQEIIGSAPYRTTQVVVLSLPIEKPTLKLENCANDSIVVASITAAQAAHITADRAYTISYYVTPGTEPSMVVVGVSRALSQPYPDSCPS